MSARVVVGLGALLNVAYSIVVLLTPPVKLVSRILLNTSGLLVLTKTVLGPVRPLLLVGVLAQRPGFLAELNSTRPLETTRLHLWTPLSQIPIALKHYLRLMRRPQLVPIEGVPSTGQSIGGSSGDMSQAKYSPTGHGLAVTPPDSKMKPTNLFAKLSVGESAKRVSFKRPPNADANPTSTDVSSGNGDESDCVMLEPKLQASPNGGTSSAGIQ